jgi:porin
MRINTKKIFFFLLVSVLSIQCGICGNTSLELIRKTNKCGWLIFGQGVLDSTADIESCELMVQVDWHKSVWGVGGMYTLNNPINGQDIYAVQVEIRTLKGSKVRAYAGIATTDDANMMSDRKRALPVSEEWEVFTFPISQMRNERPDVTSRDFTNKDWKRVQRIKLLFVKPLQEAVNQDDIFIRNPKLVMANGVRLKKLAEPEKKNRNWRTLFKREKESSQVRRIKYKETFASFNPLRLFPKASLNALRNKRNLAKSRSTLEDVDHDHGHPRLFHTRHANFLKRWRNKWNLQNNGSPFEDIGIELYGDIFADYSSVINGGIRTNDALRNTFDIGLIVHLDKFLGWDNGIFSVYTENFSGDNGTDDTGDFQFYSNLDADNYRGYFEVWLERTYFDERLRVKVGKVDANTEFAYVENGVEFLNASMLFSPTIFVMPTIPNSSASINVFFDPAPDIYAGVGVYDGGFQEGRRTGTGGFRSILDDSSDLFLISEFGGSWKGPDKEHPGSVSVGMWYHNGTFDRFDGINESGTSGFYFVMNQRLTLNDTVIKEEVQTVDAFFQYGFADEAVSDIKHHIGGGLVWNGPLQERKKDNFGMGATWVDFSNESGAEFSDAFELSYELFYKFLITENFSLKPDIQYIVNPGGDGTAGDATVATLRLELNF